MPRLQSSPLGTLKPTGTRRGAPSRSREPSRPEIRPLASVSTATKTCPQCGETYDFEQRFCPRDGSTLRAPPGSNLVGSVLADRYHIVRRIGEGGMGQVYLAEHVKMKRRSAVKVLHQGLVNDPDAIARFNREASNASQIQHPNVAAIYDFGETADGLIYLAMEFVDGEPLTKVIEHDGALSATRAVEITRQVADALGAAHHLGIIHRDLKPDNIMIARGRGGEDVAKVVDFGIAKATRSEEQKVTRTGLAIGTPEYMAPEQLAGDRLDTRTDIYALGLVAFNMLTGQLPFPAVSSREAMIARLTDRPRTLAEIKNDVPWPAEVQTVMDRALATHPEERYAQAEEFAHDLVRAIAAMPPTAFSRRGTLAAAAVDPIGATVARPAATPPSVAATRARRPTPVIASTRAVETESSTGRGVLAAFLVLLLVVAGGGGVWYWRTSRLPASGTAAAPAAHTPSSGDSAASPAAANSGAPAPASAAAASPTDSAATDSLQHSIARAPGGPADSAAVPAAVTSDSMAAPLEQAAAPKAASAAPAPPANLEALLSPIREDLAVGRARMNDGEYEGARVRFEQAMARLGEVGRMHPGLAPVQALRSELAQARRANRDACVAEQQLAQRRGEQGPVCR